MNVKLTACAAAALYTLIGCAPAERPADSPAAQEAAAGAAAPLEQPAPAPTGALESRLDAALAAPGRPAADKALDATRKPESVIAFFEVGDGQTVLDVNAAGGYYTELLSAAVGPAGTVYAQNDPATLEREDGAVDKELTQRLDGERLPNVVRLEHGLGELGLNGDVDVAFLVLTLHDIYNFQGREGAVAALKDIYATLKPGGILGVVDHVGEASRALDAQVLHRIEKHKAEELLEAAGFAIDAESDMLRNPEDDHTTSVFDRAVRRHTDRFVLRAVRPF